MSGAGAVLELTADGHVITEWEHRQRMQRVRSVACPDCLSLAGHACASGGNLYAPSHQARWDAYYAAQRSTP